MCRVGRLTTFSGMAAGGTPLTALQFLLEEFLTRVAKKNEVAGDCVKTLARSFENDFSPASAHLIGSMSHSFTVLSRLPDARHNPSGRWKKIKRVTWAL